MDIRSATPDDLDDVVTVLTAAFLDDPLMAWVFRDDGARPRRLTALWRFMAGEAYLPRGGSTIVPGPDAGALWLAPGEVLDGGFWAPRFAGFAAALEGDIERLSSLGEALQPYHPHGPDHWYLLALGVAPARQGLRLGTALLAHTLTQADAAGAPAYLEASSPRNRVLYERFGFEALGELTVEDSPPVWPMWREPSGT